MKKSLILLPLMMGLVISTNVIAENQNIEPARAAATCEVHDTEEDHGFIVADKNKGYEGDKINLTVAPDLGYEIINVWANDQLLKAQKEGQYTFNMKAGTNKVHAEFGFNLMQTTVKFPEKFQGHYFLSHKLATPGTEATFKLSEPNNHTYQHITKVTFNGAEMHAIKQPGDGDGMYWYKYIVNNERNEIEVFMHEDPKGCSIALDVSTSGGEFKPTPTATIDKDFLEIGETTTVHFNYDPSIGYLSKVYFNNYPDTIEIPFALNKDERSFDFNPWLYCDANDLNDEWNREFKCRLTLEFRVHPPKIEIEAPRIRAGIFGENKGSFEMMEKLDCDYKIIGANEFNRIFEGDEYQFTYETFIPEHFAGVEFLGAYGYVNNENDKDKEYFYEELRKDETTGNYKFIAGRHLSIQLRYTRATTRIAYNVIGNEIAIKRGTKVWPGQIYYPGDTYRNSIDLRYGYYVESILVNGKPITFARNQYDEQRFEFSFIFGKEPLYTITVTVKKNEAFAGEYKRYSKQDILDLYNRMLPKLKSNENKSLRYENYEGIYHQSRTINFDISPENGIAYQNVITSPSLHDYDYVPAFKTREFIKNNTYTRVIEHEAEMHHEILEEFATPDEIKCYDSPNANQYLDLTNDPRLANVSNYAKNLYDLHNAKLVSKVTKQFNDLLNRLDQYDTSEVICCVYDNQIIIEQSMVTNSRNESLHFSINLLITDYGTARLSFDFSGRNEAISVKFMQGEQGSDIYAYDPILITEAELNALHCPLFKDFNAFCSTQTTNKQ